MNFSVEDKRCIEAAEGWLVLSSPDDAFAELENITVEFRAHPEVLKLRWQIFNKSGKHYLAFTVAHGLTRIAAEDPEPFIWRSYSARRMQGGGVEKAMTLLLEVVHNFPDEPVVAFSLASYNAALGKIVEARNWLHIAFDVAERNGTAKQWKAWALDDADLEPLREVVDRALNEEVKKHAEKEPPGTPRA